jgi:anti-anti-sigma regulatory factor
LIKADNSNEYPALPGEVDMIVEARRDVITLRGSLTDNEWPTIQAAARILLEEYPKGIIIDCSRLSEVTEAGAKTFLDAINYIQRYDAKIIVAGLPQNAIDVIRSVRAVMSQLPIAPTVEAARASLGLEDLTTSMKPTQTGARIIAVILVGDWEKAMQIACSVGDRRRDEIHMIDMLKVPRSMPLATPLPEDEAAARRKLDDSERMAKQCRLKSVRHVERVRILAEGLQRVQSMLQPEKLIVAISKVTDDNTELVNTVMPGLLGNPPCEIIYVRRPEDTL